jgi:hypothetical protein
LLVIRHFPPREESFIIHGAGASGAKFIMNEDGSIPRVQNFVFFRVVHTDVMDLGAGKSVPRIDKNQIAKDKRKYEITTVYKQGQDILMFLSSLGLGLGLGLSLGLDLNLSLSLGRL